jgi:beta-glucosidase
MTSAKHYIAYEQEHFRLTSEAAASNFNTTECGSANLDDITMHEMYLWPFAGKSISNPALFYSRQRRKP